MSGVALCVPLMHLMLVSLSKRLSACKCKCLEICCGNTTEKLPLVLWLSCVTSSKRGWHSAICVVLCVVQDPWQAQWQTHSPRRAKLDLHSHHWHNRLERAAQRWSFTHTDKHYGLTLKLVPSHFNIMLSDFSARLIRWDFLIFISESFQFITAWVL